MTSLEVPTSFLNNLETIIAHQNIKLITEICKWKGWDSQELITEFMGDTIIKDKITKSKVKMDNQESVAKQSSKQDEVTDDNGNSLVWVVAVRINYEWIPLWVGCPREES